MGAAAGSASPRERNESDERAGTVSIGQEAELVVLELGGGRAECPERLGLGPRDAADFLRVGPAGQVDAQLLAGLITVLRILAHELPDHRAEGGGDAGGHALQGIGVFHPMLEDLVDHVPPSNGGRPARAK